MNSAPTLPSPAAGFETASFGFVVDQWIKDYTETPPAGGGCSTAWGSQFEPVAGDVTKDWFSRVAGSPSSQPSTGSTELSAAFDEWSPSVLCEDRTPVAEAVSPSGTIAVGNASQEEARTTKPHETPLALLSAVAVTTGQDDSDSDRR